MIVLDRAGQRGSRVLTIRMWPACSSLTRPRVSRGSGRCRSWTGALTSFIGGIGFFGPPDDEGTVELGYGVAPDVEGRDYATEALRGALRYAFGTGSVRRVVADTTHVNEGSQRVMERRPVCARFRADEQQYFYEFLTMARTGGSHDPGA